MCRVAEELTDPFSSHYHPTTFVTSSQRSTACRNASPTLVDSFSQTQSCSSCNQEGREGRQKHSRWLFCSILSPSKHRMHLVPYSTLPWHLRAHQCGLYQRSVKGMPPQTLQLNSASSLAPIQVLDFLSAQIQVEMTANDGRNSTETATFAVSL